MLVHAELFRAEPSLLAHAAAGVVDSLQLTGGSTWATARPGLPNRVAITQAYYRGDAAGSLEVPTLGEAKGNGTSITLTQDVYRGVRVTNPATSLTEIHGAAVRLVVSFRSLAGDISTKGGLASLAGIAASVEAGQTTASYRFELIGMTDTSSIATKIPLLGGFDADAYLQLVQATNVVVQHLLSAPPESLSLEPLFVDLDETAANPFGEAAVGWIRGLGDVLVDSTDFEGEGGADRAAFAAAQSAARRRDDPVGWARDELHRLKDAVGHALDQ